VVIVAEHAFSATASAFFCDSAQHARLVAASASKSGSDPGFAEIIEFIDDNSIANIHTQRGSQANSWIHLYPTQFCSTRRLAAVQQLVSFIWDKPVSGVTWCTARDGASGNTLSKPYLVIPSFHSIKPAVDAKPATLLQEAKSLLTWAIVPETGENLYLSLTAYRVAITKMLQNTWRALDGNCPWPEQQEAAIAQYLQRCVFDEAGNSNDSGQLLDFYVTQG
jgi:hypothetical protein